MGFHINYSIPELHQGQCLILSDKYFWTLSNSDACLIAGKPRCQLSAKSPWQSVKGKLIHLIKTQKELNNG